MRIAILPLRIYLVSFFSYCCMRCVCLPQNQYLQIKNLGSFSAWQSRAFLLFIRIHFTTSLSHNNFFSLTLLLFHAIRLYYFGVLKCLKHLLRLVCYSRIWSSFRIEHVILFPFVTKIGLWWFLSVSFYSFVLACCSTAFRCDVVAVRVFILFSLIWAAFIWLEPYFHYHTHAHFLFSLAHSLVRLFPVSVDFGRFFVWFDSLRWYSFFVDICLFPLVLSLVRPFLCLQNIC